MGVEGLTEENQEKPDFAQLQKDAMAREERQKKEKDEYRRARQVRLGHVEDVEKKRGPGRPKKSETEAESKTESE